MGKQPRASQMIKTKPRPSVTKSKSAMRQQAQSAFESPQRSAPVSKSKATMRSMTPSKYQPRQSVTPRASKQKIFRKANAVAQDYSMSIPNMFIEQDLRQKSAQVDPSPFVSPNVTQRPPKEEKATRVSKLKSSKAISKKKPAKLQPAPSKSQTRMSTAARARTKRKTSNLFTPIVSPESSPINSKQKEQYDPKFTHKNYGKQSPRFGNEGKEVMSLFREGATRATASTAKSSNCRASPIEIDSSEDMQASIQKPGNSTAAVLELQIM